MSGMDRLTDEVLERWNKTLEWDDKHSAGDSFDSDEVRELMLMARELLAHRRASQAAPASRIESSVDRLRAVLTPSQAAPTSSAPDGRVAEYEAAYQYALGLANALVQRHYADNGEWRPLGELVGLLTQIDNMVACLVRPDAPAPSDGLREAATMEDLAEAAVASGVSRSSFSQEAEWCHDQASEARHD